MITIVGDMFFADMNDDEAQEILSRFSRNTIFAYNSRIKDNFEDLPNDFIFLQGKYDPGGKPYITAPTIKIIDGKKFLLVPYTRNLPKYAIENINGEYYGIILAGKVPFDIQRTLSYVTGAKIIISRPETDAFVHFETNHSTKILYAGVKSRNGYILQLEPSTMEFTIKHIKTPQRRLLL